MGRIFDDPCQQARQEFAESYDEEDYGDGALEPFRQEDDEDEYSSGEETLSNAEIFHYLLYADTPDWDWEEINRKVLAGATPSGKWGK